MCLSLETLMSNVHHKDWSTYSGRTYRSRELCYSFNISIDLTQMVNIPAWIPDCDSHFPALLDLFISSDASICSAMPFPQLQNVIMLQSQFLLTLHQIHIRMPRFIT